MIFRFLIAFAILASASFDSSAFNKDKCWEYVRPKTCYVGFDCLFAFSAGTSSFFTSTGDCSALASNIEEIKERYITANKDHLLKDVAKGQGEYLSAYASLLGCKNSYSFSSEAKDHFELVHESMKRNDLRQVRLTLDQLHCSI